MLINQHEYIKENYLRIREQMEVAAQKSGRSLDEVTLLAATKTVDVDKINYAISLGLDHIGENRVQEMMEKYENLNLENCHNHFIGRLQTNKIKYLINKVSCIHSIDSINQVKELSRLLQKNNSKMDILVEVNVGQEDNKGGVNKSELFEFIDQARTFDGINIKGLMCVPPISEKIQEKLYFFDKMYNYYVDIQSKKLDNIDMSILSVGMSDDFPQAIECGSNLVRIGSRLFGNRIYK